jgi:flagellar FliJ protein
MAAASALNTLQQLAGKHVDAAADKLAAANKQLRDAEAQLLLLQGYRQDYLDKLARQLVTGLDAQAHQNFQRFMRMLDQAIVGQEELIQVAEAQVQQALAQWRQSQKKKLSYEVLCDRSHKKTQLVELKRDQKLMDEHAMRSRKFS